MQIYQHLYIHLDREVREKLIKVFNIQKSGVSEILDQTLISDGVTNQDLSVITSKAMSEYLGVSEELPFSFLWEQVLSKISSKDEVPLTGEVLSIEQIINEPLEVSDETLEISEGRYCQTCTSNGGRHKKGCPQYR